MIKAIWTFFLMPQIEIIELEIGHNFGLVITLIGTEVNRVFSIEPTSYHIYYQNLFRTNHFSWFNHSNSQKMVKNTFNLSSLLCPYFRQSELRTPIDSTQYQWLKYGHSSDTNVSVCVRMSVVSVFQSHPHFSLIFLTLVSK